MGELFDRIYNDVLFYERDIAEMNQTAERRNKGILFSETFKDRLDEKEREKLLGLLDDAALNASKEGFYMGFRYASFLLHCYNHTFSLAYIFRLNYNTL